MWRGLALACALLGAGPAAAEVLSARYVTPTDAYGHGVLPGGEYAGLEFTLSGGRLIGAGTYQTVYEDTAPRLADLDHDGTPEVITVISYFDGGAALRIWDEVANPDHPEGSTMAVVAETPPIGRRNRWLAPIGIADFNGDGQVDIAYIDRPHLARTLRVWSYVAGGLTGQGALREIASLEGLTNHRIGEPFITGGARDCGTGPEMIVADRDWRQVIAVAMRGDTLETRTLAPFSQDAVAAALACQL